MKRSSSGRSRPRPRTVAPSATRAQREPPRLEAGAATERAGLVLVNAGESTIEVLAHGSDALVLGPGERAVLRPRLLRAAGVPAGSGGPMVVAPKAALAFALRSRGTAGRAALDTASLRAQGALYGAPELFVLDAAAGSVTQRDAVDVRLAGDVPVTIVLVGRGPALNLELAIQALSRRDARGPARER